MAGNAEEDAVGLNRTVMAFSPSLAIQFILQSNKAPCGALTVSLFQDKLSLKQKYNAALP